MNSFGLQPPAFSLLMMVCGVLATGCVLKWDRTWDQGPAVDTSDAAKDGPPSDRPAPDAPLPDVGGDLLAPPKGWATGLGAQGVGSGYGVAVDKADNAYVTGYFKDELRSGTITLSTKGKLDIFVARLTSAGKVQWAISGGGTDDDRGNAVVVDAKGAVYVCGFFVGSLTFGGKKYAGSNRDLFLARILADGTVDWVKTFSGSGWAGCADLALDTPRDHLWLTGKFNGSLAFGAKKLTSATSKYDLYVTRVSAKDGEAQKALRAGGPGNDIPTAVNVDPSGNAYVAGYFDGSIGKPAGTFGTTTLSCKGGYDIFVAKVPASGDGFQWAVSSGSTAHDEILGMAVDATGYAYITGYHGGPMDLGGLKVSHSKNTDLFAAKVAPTGKFLWATSTTGLKYEVGEGVALGPANDVVVTGYINGPATLDGKILPYTGERDAVVLRLTSAKGALTWRTSTKGLGKEQARGLAVRGQRAYMVGYLQGTGVFGSSTVKAEGQDEAFVWMTLLP